MSALTQFLKDHFLSCPFRENLHMQCAGCGIQRSFVALLEGHLLESLALYPALIPLISVWLFAVFHLIFKFKHGAAIIKYLFLFCAVIIGISYVIKIVNKEIFV